MDLQNKSFYVVPTWKCNLKCPHCFVNNIEYKADFNALLKTLRQCYEKYPDAEFVLHGGEPTFNKDLLKQLLDTGIITSITSNLLTEDPDIIDMINKSNISTATSWNPKRFKNDKLYQVWQNNILQLNNKPLILITLDKDLMEYAPQQVLNIITKFQGIDKVLFEPLLDNTLNDDFQDKVDSWLCDLYDIWDSVIKNVIAEQILNWRFDCNSQTILPDGSLRNKCTMANNDHKPVFLSKCLHCPYNKVCIPCSLHTRCSFYPKFYEKVKSYA